MKHLMTIIIFFLVGISVLEAQDPHFSQFYISPVSLNPALTGLKSGNVRVTANYRRQWASISNPYQTMAVSADYNILKSSLDDNLLGVGLTIFNDKAGTGGLRRTEIALSTGYSQNLGLDGAYISVGFKAGAIQQRIDIDQLLFESQYDGESLNGGLQSGENNLNSSNWDYDLAAGLAWSYTPDKNTSFYAGGSISHLNRPERGFIEGEEDQLDMKYSIYGGMEVRVSGYVSVIPRAIILKQGPHQEINMGGYVKLHLSEPSSENSFSLNIGGMYRLKDAVIPMVRVDYGPIGVGISYDLNVSSLSAASNGNGGLEMAFVYKGVSGGADDLPVSCPEF